MFGQSWGRRSIRFVFGLLLEVIPRPHALGFTDSAPEPAAIPHPHDTGPTSTLSHEAMVAATRWGRMSPSERMAELRRVFEDPWVDAQHRR